MDPSSHTSTEYTVYALTDLMAKRLKKLVKNVIGYFIFCSLISESKISMGFYVRFSDHCIDCQICFLVLNFFNNE